MSRCDGVRSVADVITDIEKSFGLSGIGADVHAFVALALERHWLELRE
jgi:pyrroloquinoline quinone biosynthesis protein D